MIIEQTAKAAADICHFFLFHVEFSKCPSQQSDLLSSSLKYNKIALVK